MLRYLVILLSLICACCADGAQSKPNSLTARQILDRMAKTYANCRSYRDSGVAKTVYTGSCNQVEVKPFATAFVRPDRFRFEYTQKDPLGETHYIVWQAGRDVRTYWDLHSPPVQRESSLEMAVAGATGVSSGTAIMIPTLLLPTELNGPFLTGLTGLRRLSDAKLGSVPCFRIRAKLAGEDTTLWIDSKTALVRRIDGKHKFTDFTTQQTTTYEPLINTAISKQTLGFNPPKRKRGR